MLEEVNYCQRCGYRLARKEIYGRERPYCPSCGLIVYFDPKVAVVVLVVMDGKLVLVRRAIQPFLGHWSFPSGYVDRGEVVEDAAVREVKEETGLDVCLGSLVGLYSLSGNPMILAVYTAKVTHGQTQRGPEVQEIGVFSVDDLPPLPFPHDSKIIEDWLALRGS